MTSTDSPARPAERAHGPAVLPLATLLVRPRPWLLLAAPPADEPFRQEPLPLTYSLPNGLDATPRGGAPTRVRPDDPSIDRTSVRAAGRQVDADMAPVPARPDTSPNLWASRFLQAVVEVVCSDRPLPQLARWTAPTVYETIAQAQRAVTAGRRDTMGRAVRPYVASVHVCHIEPDAAEVAARVVGGQRSRALAARLDYRQDRWTCTALQFG